LSPLSPFSLGYREAEHHLMAFFDGHPELEAVECMALRAREAGSTQPVLAIVTHHDNTQEYYVNFDEVRLRRSGLVAVHRADARCHVEEDWLHASLEFDLRSGEHVSLRYVGAGPPDAKWSLIPDPGQHNPTGGLVAMLPMQTTLGTASSELTIGGRGYPLVPHEASQPPYFVAVHAYLARDFRFAYVGTYRRAELVIEPDDSEQAAGRFLSPVDGVEAEIVATDNGVGEIRALVASDPAVAEAGHNVRLELNPPLPNLLAMQAGSRAELRFALSFGFREEPVAYGDVVVERRADAVELRVLPRYPGWAARHRRLLCMVQPGTDRVGTECHVLLDRDLASIPCLRLGSPSHWGVGDVWPSSEDAASVRFAGTGVPRAGRRAGNAAGMQGVGVCG
jgi:hypothetical protein